MRNCFITLACAAVLIDGAALDGTQTEQSRVDMTRGHTLTVSGPWSTGQRWRSSG